MQKAKTGAKKSRAASAGNERADLGASAAVQGHSLPMAVGPKAPPVPSDMDDGLIATPSSPYCWMESGMVLLDDRQTIVTANADFAGFFGMRPEAMAGQSFSALLNQAFPGWSDDWIGLWNGGEMFGRINVCGGQNRPGQWFQAEFIRAPGQSCVRIGSILPPAGVLAESALDEHLSSPASQRQMMMRLLQAETQLDTLVNRWPGVIFSQRPDCTFHFISPKIEELTGVPVVLWKRSPDQFWRIVHESDVDELKQQMKRAMRSPNGVSSTFRIRHAKTGQVAYIMEHRHAIVSGNGLLLGYEGVWLDVTRQTIAENRLSSAAWKETLAVVTMGLAHDFSNIMAGIHSLSETYLSQIEQEHPFREGLTLIRQHSMLASQLVQRIIQLHHGKTGERNYHSLNEIIRDVIDLAIKILSRRVQVELALSEEALPLYVDAVEFRQVILNLTLNASDAMPNGGKLVFRTALIQQMPSHAIMAGTPPKFPAICLTVRDTGTGISPSHLKSIFDPFFTTKAVNKGSGLGLYNARLFVEKHQGSISVESTEGQGTAFHIWLPQADFSEAERGLAPAEGRRQSLLLVGQSSEFMDGTTEFLRVRGYHVVTAHHREEILEVLDLGHFQFEAIFLIVESSRNEWVDLLEAMRPKQRRLKVVLQIAGCNQDELSTQLLAQADTILGPGSSEQDILEKLSALLSESGMRL
jgi:signal transduction histidine kinase